jgi:hypothetical protein
MRLRREKGFWVKGKWRCVNKTFDALGAGPDAVYGELERLLSDVLPA